MHNYVCLTSSEELLLPGTSWSSGDMLVWSTATSGAIWGLVVWSSDVCGAPWSSEAFDVLSVEVLGASWSSKDFVTLFPEVPGASWSFEDPWLLEVPGASWLFEDPGFLEVPGVSWFSEDLVLWAPEGPWRCSFEVVLQADVIKSMSVMIKVKLHWPSQVWGVTPPYLLLLSSSSSSGGVPALDDEESWSSSSSSSELGSSSRPVLWKAQMRPRVRAVTIWYWYQISARERRI